MFFTSLIILILVFAILVLLICRENDELIVIIG